ncbi:galactose-6-phosphate isomerase subunit LacA [Granulicatella sp. zg-ZJ]|uniref:galactose-6-phosphate isomerase subunit LacA n=1 Tax=unclassified Granulicatella TaxID=2630493 RepID=UPI0013BFE1EE|nr:MULTISPECIES: galactose-6-phosphate isomerase subunit LacA [unclassified Granulicatella]NEW63238.1 galactose-6-phosphate isomerase subunit LacA [Granulicatella sp. zg-ZJ]NEW65974.1 galactose-6-phosphate isomerase subunit LacA [Granulicatella sp. zg-84]QMI86610.1 galactose-6-phosphate isomerase subunit LacA [Carnobacteriaceae bacterium zg-84]
MNVILGADTEGEALKNDIKTYLLSRDYNVIDLSASDDFVDTTYRVAMALKKDVDSLGIVFDGYGAGSFITATKIKGIIAAEVSDERSAYMTRGHNNAKLITIGANIVGKELAKQIVIAFLSAHYDGGRHQIRVDMLNKMC